MLVAMNTPTPSNSGLLKSASEVDTNTTEENKADMKIRRKTIRNLRVEIYTTSVRVEGDAAYNNPIYSGTGKTPFQIAT